MLQKIYIDNFRCLVNFELKVDSINLFLGSNGSGKSTVFEALRKIQAFVSGDSKVEDIFKSADCTRWQTSQIQRFELGISGNGGSYKYELGIGHNQDKCHVEYERVWFDNQPLYCDTHSERGDNTKLTWFKERMVRFIIIKSDYNLENCISRVSTDQVKITELSSVLREVLEGFFSFQFEQESLVLKLQFSSEEPNSKLIEYLLEELSDGEKTLIALYTLLYGTNSEDYTLCIEEPGNFLALPEIQPWLTQLYDLCSSGQLQALLISHHPEVINYLLASPIGYWFERQSNAAVQVKKISDEVANNSGLPVSELITRRWLKC